MDIQTVNNYIQKFTTPDDEILQQLTRETFLKVLMPQQISSPYQGRLLTMLTKMLRPSRILEIGTFTGYTAICFAYGLPQDGKVHTIEMNEENEDLIRKYLKLAHVEDSVELHIGNALEIIPQLEDEFDLVFIDATKKEYKQYYELIFSKVKTGGFILADNAFRNAKVFQEKHDKKTAAIHAFNQMIQADDRVENILLPIDDGIMIAYKIS
jgi:predicted O-methyltransferase YrrM